MLTRLLRVPPLVGLLVARFPAFPGSVAFAAVANLAMQEKMDEELKSLLCGRLLRITITDLRVRFNILWTSAGFVAAWDSGEPELEISASLHDFIQLAIRREDADTLFFNRRLVMEGDTELGVYLKNTVDSLELDFPALLRQAPMRALAMFLKKN